MELIVDPAAARLVRAGGGRLWVWAARPRVCCWGTPAEMRTATEPPPRLSGFQRLPHPGLEIWFRPCAGRAPGVLEIGVRGRRHPCVEAYWDGCRVAL